MSYNGKKIEQFERESWFFYANKHPLENGLTNGAILVKKRRKQ